MKILEKCIALSAVTAGMGSMAIGQTVSVNFASDAVGGGGAGDGILAPGDIAGVLPLGNWNSFPLASGSQSGLIDSTGATTPIGVSWSAASALWSTNDEDDPNDFGGGAGPDHTMMSGYLDYNVGNPATITFSGLAANTPVNLYLYSLTAVNNRQAGEWSVNGGSPQQAISQQSTAYDAGGPDLTPGVADGGEAGNYLLFSAISTGAGNVVLNSTGLEFRSAVNGIQLQVVPEPTTVALALLGTVGVMSLRRRR